MAKIDEISRTPVSLVKMTLDFCQETFSAAPCTATGEPCYNTWKTCKDKANYNKGTKDYKFTSCRAPLPFQEGERPYVDRISCQATEIKDSLTTKTRARIILYDEPDTDVGIDPYVDERSSVQGTFWKKLLARNPNYRGRYVSVYEGFYGETEGSFVEKFVGKLDNVVIKGAQIELEIVDLLKALDDIEVPPKLDVKLVTDISDTITSITVSSVTDLDSPEGYIRIDDEVIKYEGINVATNQLTDCTRGYLGTDADSHSINDKVMKVRRYAGNPFDVLQVQMLTEDAGYDSNRIDATGFADAKGWPGGEIDFEAYITDHTKLSKLYFEIIELLNLKSWVGEDLKITVARTVPNRAGRSYHELSDEANIVHQSGAVDLNEDARITRVALYWDKDAIGKVDEEASYSRISIAADQDAEGPNENDAVIEKKIFCRWMRTGILQEEILAGFAGAAASRLLRHYRDAHPLLMISVELKDSAIKTGEYAKITTDEILNVDGSALTRQVFQVVKREAKDRLIYLATLRMPKRKIAIWGASTLPAYSSATEAQKEYGFWTGDDGKVNGDEGYVWY